ncbi:glyoxylase-like metal-dependent hydrolase (beta-lactamase superfamily II) [Alicyclobacillus cycloheptanicus]|uniref:Glyoxylase-like metal-dependent hydrolase (Beta-lactamase superfamily II) n=1 Tax=Alicyclobacillus cycloheptanicus TaxID=1457 RepID=A0ABT9XHL9_9BACL|nr:glyoxylase-like metal-dependent hydrolase (beta-lactamase superfamily II) [Alicyclobacillus cycloheptanicus]
MFDTGGFGDRPELIRRLQDRGIRLTDIDYVILSHMHFDHAANVSMFPQATVYLHEAEVQHAKAARFDDFALCTEVLEMLQQGSRLKLLTGADGVVEGHRWMHTPGHTPGGISIILKGEDGANWVAAGDAVKNLHEAETGDVWMSMDRRASQESIQKVLSIADYIIPGHDRQIRIQHTEGECRLSAKSDSEITIEVAGDVPTPFKVSDVDGGLQSKTRRLLLQLHPDQGESDF